MSVDSPELSALQQGWAEQHGSLLVVLRRSRGLLQAEVEIGWGPPKRGVELGNRYKETLGRSVATAPRRAQRPTRRPIPVTRTEAVAEPASPDRLASAEAAVPDEQVNDLRRFLRQIRIFERLSEAAESRQAMVCLRRLAEGALPPCRL